MNESYIATSSIISLIFSMEAVVQKVLSYQDKGTKQKINFIPLSFVSLNTNISSYH